jgi:hypothetical protein
MSDEWTPNKPIRIFKQELYAQELSNGLGQSEAYEKAGYKPNAANASHLADQHNITQRVDWLRERKAKRRAITKESLCDELDAARDLAMAESQAAAAISAVLGKAKLMGMLVDKQERKNVNDFGELSDEALRERLIEKLEKLGLLGHNGAPTQADE